MINPDLAAVVESPIGETKAWLDGKDFPDHKPLLNVSQAVPGYPPATALSTFLESEVHDFDTARYTPILGTGDLREALAADISSAYGATMRSDSVGITAGCNEAFCVATMAVAERGSEVVLPVPYYFNHDMWLRSMGVVPRYLPVDDSMVPDPERAGSLIGERTRAIVLVTPNNPTGAVYPPDVIGAFRDVARSHSVPLIIDETYRDFLPSEEPAHRLFDDPQWDATVIHLYSFSKAFSITGYRVGAVAASTELLAEIAKLLDCLTICPPAIAQRAALYGLRHLSGWRKDRRDDMQRKIRRFLAAMAGSAWRVRAAGGFFAYVEHPFDGTSARDVAIRLLDEQHLLALSGDMFGPNQNAFLRLAFGNLEHAEVDDLVARLEALSA